MTSNFVRHCFCTYCTKEHRCLLHFSIIMSHSVLTCTYSVGNKTKIKTETGLRPVLSEDRCLRPHDWLALADHFVAQERAI